MKIHIFNDQSDLPLATDSALRVVREVLKLENIETDEVTCTFVTTEEICRLHAEFFDDPTPTDCISFPMDFSSSEEGSILGEVFVCPKTAIDYASAHGEDKYEEATLYLVHGLLHLIGFDDIEQDDEKLMRQAEKKLMTHLKSHGLMLSL